VSINPKPQLNIRNKMDGLQFHKQISDTSIRLVFFDPQYRGILDKQKYGNEGYSKMKARCQLPQMNDELIATFIKEIDRILKPSAHLMLWVDKYMLVNSLHSLCAGTSLQLVDFITWDKGKIGLGYRTRKKSEYLVIFQKQPVRIKGIWQVHNIPDVWQEKIVVRKHTHSKPVELQKRLIEAVTEIGETIVDPAAGGYSVLSSANEVKRNFLGCDILG
jgi:site-specific DNA-methyltransferase (adenine-specific)